MCLVDAGVQNGDLDWAIWSDATIDLMCAIQVDRLWRPLRDVCSIVAAHTPRIANAPGITDAPRVAATNRWFENEVWFNENDTRILRQRVDAILDGSAVGNSQSEDGPGAELIEGNRIEEVSGSNRGQIAGAGELYNYFMGDVLVSTVARSRNTVLMRACQQAGDKKQ
jgi:hypothetical protein